MGEINRSPGSLTPLFAAFTAAMFIVFNVYAGVIAVAFYLIIVWKSACLKHALASLALAGALAGIAVAFEETILGLLLLLTLVLQENWFCDNAETSG